MTLIDRVGRALLLGDGAGLSDGQLLERFRAQRDEAAFAALVKRHGPMVWGVCRRLLRSHHDAEDAFQAVFLVLVQKAASIRPADMVANWLHGVAYHAAVRARSLSHKRQARERSLAAAALAVAAPEAEDGVGPLLDRELNGLPDKYRVSLILCDLEGKTRREAARLLGVPQGTLSARLDRARRMLARRLVRRGLELPALGLATLLAREAAAGPGPATLLSKTVSLLTGGMASAVVPDRVAALAKGVITSMALSRCKILVAALLVIGGLALGAAGSAYLAWAAEPALPAGVGGGPAAVADNEPQGGGKGKKPQPALVEDLVRSLKDTQLQLARTQDENEVLKRKLDEVTAKLEEVTAKLNQMQKDKEGKGKLVLKVYAVGDLVGEQTGDGPGVPGKGGHEGTALIKIITKVIDPDSWQAKSDGGTVEYFPLGKGLVISQTPEVHLRIQMLLDELRKLNAQQPKKEIGGGV